MMLECAAYRIPDYTSPPTPEAIEQNRQEQLRILKDIRRRLLTVRRSARPAA